jgi:hypothetical protein
MEGREKVESDEDGHYAISFVEYVGVRKPMH